VARIEILTIGDELVEGRLVDTNAGELSARLADLGLAASEHRSVGDDMGEMVRVLREAADRADAVLVSGGLGPTSDDLTAAAAAAAFGLEIERSAEALEHTSRFFAERGREMPRTNEKQADLPAGCTILPNSEGTAVGFALRVEGCQLFFMPGVPRELRRMAEDSVVPDLVRRFGAEPPLVSTVKVFGIGESDVAQRLEGLDDAVPDGSRLTVQYRATFPEIHVRLVLDGADRHSGTDALTVLTEETRARLGRHLFAVGGAKLDTDFPGAVARKLVEAGLSIAAAELSSGGRVAQLLEGSEAGRRCLRGSLVAPDETTLRRLLDTGDGSPEAIARAVRSRLDADLGVATLGAARGSDEDGEGALVVAAAGPNGAKTRELHFPIDADRFQRLAAYAALGMAMRIVSTNR
jgi:nicotinamide-nucleotide amidase